jgi:cell division septum initiation protein DivIVA
MNENRFLRNLNQQSSRAVEPIPSQPVPQPVRRSEQTDSSSAEYDPIKRLTDELSRHSQAIEGLNTRIDRMEQRPKAATQAEVQTLLEEAREGVSFTIDSKQIAGFVLPELTKGMPSAEEIRTAANAGASQIVAVGNAAADQIERAGSSAAERIRWASQSKADAFAGRVGFTSWQAAVVVFLGFALLIVGVYFLNSEREAALSQARSETQAVREFTDWVKAQPEGKRLYDRYYNP